VEPRRGSQTQAVAYCSKGESRLEGPWTWGEAAEDARRRLGELTDRVSRGEPAAAMATLAPELYVRHARGLQALEEATFVGAWRDVKCFYVYGPTGCGKSSLVYDTFGYSDVYALASQAPLWFDGYRGERVLFIDEYSRVFAREAFLRLLDGHPFRAPIKGAFVPARYVVVVVCSNFPLWQAFDDAERRRFLGWGGRHGGGVWRLAGQRGDHVELGERLRAALRGDELTEPPPLPREELLRPGGGGGLDQARCGGLPLSWGV